MEALVGATPLHTPSWGPHRMAWKSTPPPASPPANQFSRRVDCAHSCIQHPPNPPKTLKTSMHEPKRATNPYNPTFHSPTTRSFIKPTYKNPPAMPNFFLTRKPQIVDEVDEAVLINTAPSPIKPTIGNLQTNRTDTTFPPTDTPPQTQNLDSVCTTTPKCGCRQQPTSSKPENYRHMVPKPLRTLLDHLGCTVN